MADPFARLPVAVLSWNPLSACSPAARWAWVAMLASPEMKRTCAGLFPASIGGLADVARVPFSEAVRLLEELVEHGLIEHDPAHRLIRFTTLPDRADRPDNGSCLVRWWKGFETVPKCPARDRHVALIRWLCEPLTRDHAKAWETTFGTIRSDHVISDTYDTVSDVVVTAGVSDTAVSLPSDTVSQVFDPPSKQQNLFDSGGSGHRVRHRVEHPTFTFPVNVNVPERRSGGEGGGSRAPLALVPPPSPGLAMLTALSKSSGGRISTLVDDRLVSQLDSVAHQCAQNGLGAEDFDLAGRFLAEGGLGHRDDLGASWAVRPGSMLDLVASARGWRDGTVKISSASGSRSGPHAAHGEADEGMSEPRPPSAFRHGRVEL